MPTEQPDPHTKDLTVVEPKPLAVTRNDEELSHAMAIMEAGIKQGMTAEQLHEVRGMLKEMRDERAATEFTAAMTAVRKECEKLPRKGRVGYTAKRSGQKVGYTYYTLEEIEDVLAGPTEHHGILYGFSDEYTEHRACRVILTISHGTHTETHHTEGPMASAVDGMDALKVSSSTVTTLRRRVLISGFGLRGMTEPDLDNQELRDPSGETLDAEQQETIDALLLELNMQTPESRKRFYAAIGTGVGKLSDIPTHRYEWAVDNLKGKIKAKQ